MVEYNISTISKRILSFVIDDIVVGIFLLIIFYDQITQLGIEVSKNNMTPQQIQELINAFVINAAPIVLAVKVLYHSLLVWQNGMTIGKYIAKIKVIDFNTGNKPSFAQALFRGSMRIVSEVLFYIGFLLAFISNKRQTFHDKVSNCVVVDV
jgi:uncharacterized RDD family membrane protein YckC